MIIYRSNQPPLLSDYGIQVPMLKGRAEKVREEITKKFGENVFSSKLSPILSREDFLRIHSEEFLYRCEKTPDDVIKETFELVNKDGTYHRYNPDFSKKDLGQLVDVYKESCGDSYLCVQEAFRNGFAYYLGGGFHHSLANRGRGFCLFNDILIAAKKFQAEIKPGPVWVIDIDAHKGCGTAAISENDESIFTLSIHMKDGWPLDSERLDENGNLNPWFTPSTVDIEVASGEESHYLQKLEEGLFKLEKQSRGKPSVCIIVDGSDPYEEDALPSADLLKLNQMQCLERNLLVYNFLRKRNFPQAYLMSGGYGDKNWIIHYQFINEVLKSGPI